MGREELHLRCLFVRREKERERGVTEREGKKQTDREKSEREKQIETEREYNGLTESDEVESRSGDCQACPPCASCRCSGSSSSRWPLARFPVTCRTKEVNTASMLRQRKGQAPTPSCDQVMSE